MFYFKASENQNHPLHSKGLLNRDFSFLFLEKILAAVDRYCMPEIRSTVTLKTAELGDDSVIYGCLALIEEHAAELSA